MLEASLRHAEESVICSQLDNGQRTLAGEMAPRNFTSIRGQWETLAFVDGNIKAASVTCSCQTQAAAAAADALDLTCTKDFATSTVGTVRSLRASDSDAKAAHAQVHVHVYIQQSLCLMQSSNNHVIFSSTQHPKPKYSIFSCFRQESYTFDASPWDAHKVQLHVTII